MKSLFEKLLFLLLLAAMLYQLPSSLDKTIAFQDAVVQQHIEHELRAKETLENENW